MCIRPLLANLVTYVRTSFNVFKFVTLLDSKTQPTSATTEATATTSPSTEQTTTDSMYILYVILYILS